MGRRFLVTGGAGYVGSHLVAALVERGDAVVVLDNLRTGHRGAVPPGVRLIVADLADTRQWTQCWPKVPGMPCSISLRSRRWARACACRSVT